MSFVQCLLLSALRSVGIPVAYKGPGRQKRSVRTLLHLHLLTATIA